MATKGASNHFGNARHGKQGHCKAWQCMLSSGMAGKAGFGLLVKASFGVLSFGRQGTSGRVKSRQVRSGQGKAGKQG